MADDLTFEFANAASEYLVSFSRKSDVYTLNFGPVGAYIRFAGNAVVERRERGNVVERASAPASWELLHFGDQQANAAS